MKKSIFVLVVFLGAAFLLFQILIPLNDSENTRLFHIEKGEGSKEIGMHLEEQKFIRSSIAFRFYVLATFAFHTLKAGDYELSSGMSLAEITQKIASGDIAKQTLMIIEGWNRNDIAQYLEEQGIPQGKDLAGSQYADLEGYLFPDTYLVRKGAVLEDVITIMRETFDTKAGNPSRDVVIMASLIEKEVRSREDKRMVSGILWKRLKIGIPLQVDATITYLTSKKKVSNGDMKIDSPYNTYRYRGLPLGPIANPGLESIQAALDPQESPYLYYLSTPEGKTIFSRTLEEHNKAKAKYLQ